MEIKILEKTGVRVSLAVPSEGSVSVLVLLPGISGGVFSERYDTLEERSISKQIACMRVESWKDGAEVSGKSIVQIHEELNEIIEFLRDSGYTTFFGVGKSFGGGVLLSYPVLSVFNSIILWAPAIGATDERGTFDDLKVKTLRDIASILDITLDAGYLASSAYSTDVFLIHGTEDDMIPFENSEHLVRLLPQGELISVEGADHSFTSPEHQVRLLEATFGALDRKIG